MKRPTYFYLPFVLLFWVSNIAWANQVSPSKSKLKNENKISFQHNKSGKTGSIYTDQEVKVWVGDRIVMGVFKKTDGENMTVLDDGENIEIPLSEVTKIRGYNEGSKKMLGILIRGIGSIGILIGAIGLIGGLISLATGSLGAIVLIAVPLLLLPGFLLYKLGSNMSGRTYKLNGKWSIKR